MKMTEAEKWEAEEAKLPNVERVARSARYDTRKRALVLVLATGAELSIPIASIPKLAKATAAELSEVELEPDGTGLHWETLDADFHVVGLVREATGQADVYRRAGAVKSAAKTAAVRENGKKGGRPRKAPVHAA